MATSRIDRRKAALPAGPTPAGTAEPPSLELPGTGLTEDRRIVHVLNRLAFGPRPGDVSRVSRLGVAAYIEQQLRPAAAADADLERRLRPLTSLSMTTPERLVTFPPRQLVMAVSRQLGSRLTSAQRIRFLPEVRSDEPRDNRSGGRTAATPGPRVIADELAQARLIRAVYGEHQLQEVLTDFWFNHFNVFVGKGAVGWWIADYEQSAIRPHALGRFRDLLGAVARHPAMLFYLDNWLSSSTRGGIDARALNYHAMEGIRNQGLPPGGLATLLLRQRGMDTAEMERRIARGDSRRRQIRATRGDSMTMEGDALPGRAGLNENFARELLELHTLGVDGGYTQQDIVEVARCFTGWSLLPLHAGQGFAFFEELHDPGPKTVLGRRIEGQGLAEGEAVLDLLARHPATARFISTKLARRLVGDEPSAELIRRMAGTFTESGGDVRAVLGTLFSAPEFWATEARKAKIKTPFEFVVSASRATAAEVDAQPASPGSAVLEVGTTGDSMIETDARAAPAAPASPASPPAGARALARTLNGLGQPLYGCRPPTGYPDRAEAWISVGALLHRIKFAMALAADRIRGVHTDVAAALAKPTFDDDALSALAWRLTGEDPRPETLQAIRRHLDLTADEVRQLGLPPGFGRTPRGPARIAAGWLLAAAEFQRR